MGKLAKTKTAAYGCILVMKRQRHYSGWEIAGLIGSTACLIFLCLSPLLFLYSAFAISYIFHDFILLDILLGILALIILITLLISQWSNPKAKLSILVPIIVLPINQYLLWVIIKANESDNIERTLNANYTSDFLQLLLMYAALTILPIWMNRPRWYNVTPSQIEAFD